MNWIILAFVIGLLIVGAVIGVSALEAKATKIDCKGCNNSCNSEKGCGLATCGAVNGGKCTCGG